MDSLTAYLLKGDGVKVAAYPMEPSLPTPLPSLTSTSTAQKYAPVTTASKAREEHLWRSWKASGFRNQDKLRELQKSMGGLIRSNVNKYKAAPVPQDLIQMDAERIFVEALKDYEPDKSRLSTHISNRLSRLHRFVSENQNVARVVENRAGKAFGMYKTSLGLARDELGREPTDMELAEKMTLEFGKPITPKQAKAFRKEDRGDRFVSDEDFTFTPTETRMLIKLLPEELTPIENQVFERYYGVNGSPKMKPGQIAKQLRMSGPKVSRILNSIKKKAEEYL